MSAENARTELGVALTKACELLKAANCPNDDCIVGTRMGRMDEDPAQCQWCHDREQLIGEHG